MISLTDDIDHVFECYNTFGWTPVCMIQRKDTRGWRHSSCWIKQLPHAKKMGVGPLQLVPRWIASIQKASLCHLKWTDTPSCVIVDRYIPRINQNKIILELEMSISDPSNITLPWMIKQGVLGSAAVFTTSAAVAQVCNKVTHNSIYLTLWKDEDLSLVRGKSEHNKWSNNNYLHLYSAFQDTQSAYKWTSTNQCVAPAWVMLRQQLIRALQLTTHQLGPFGATWGLSVLLKDTSDMRTVRARIRTTNPTVDEWPALPTELQSPLM